MTGLPSIMSVTCSRLSVLFSMARDAWMVRIRFSRRSCGERFSAVNAPLIASAVSCSLMAATSLRTVLVMVYGGYVLVTQISPVSSLWYSFASVDCDQPEPDQPGGRVIFQMNKTFCMFSTVQTRLSPYFFCAEGAGTSGAQVGQPLSGDI